MELREGGPGGPYAKIDQCELIYAFEHTFGHQEIVILQTQEVISWTQDIIIGFIIACGHQQMNHFEVCEND